MYFFLWFDPSGTSILCDHLIQLTKLQQNYNLIQLTVIKFN
jgi:hypothetical protein